MGLYPVNLRIISNHGTIDPWFCLLTTCSKRIFDQQIIMVVFEKVLEKRGKMENILITPDYRLRPLL